MTGLLAALLWLPLSATAGSMVVTVQAEDATAALERGLEQALVRIAGLRSEAVREQTARLLLELDEDGHIPALQQRRQEAEGRYRLSFDRERLRAALQAAEVPMVVGARPSLLIWVVHEQAGQRHLLGTSMDAQGVLKAIAALGEERAWPLLAPLGDLADRQAARPGDIVGGVSEPLLEAGRRYEADGVILLHLRSTASTVQARSVLAYRDREWRSEATADAAPMAAVAAVEQVVDRMLAPLARVGAEPEWSTLGFVDVQGFAAFERLRSELLVLEAVEQVRLDSLSGNRVTLEIRSRFSGDDLLEVLEASGYRSVVAPSEGSAAAVWLGRRP